MADLWQPAVVATLAEHQKEEVNPPEKVFHASCVARGLLDLDADHL